MEKDLVGRLESAVSRLEVLAGAQSAPFFSSRGLPYDSSAMDPSIAAFDDLVANSLGRVSAAARQIGGQVLDATTLLEEAFAALKQLLIKARQCQKPDLKSISEFLRPLNAVIVKVNSLTDGKRSEYFNHLKTVADSSTALAWIGYVGKDSCMRMPTAHVEESWQMAEFYSNKILVEFKNKDPIHVEWTKAIKELYLPGLYDYVKNFYPLGPVWGSAVSASASSSAVTITPRVGNPAPPAPPKAPLFSSESVPARPKEGMSAVFAEISSGQSVTSGLRKVTDDMKTKNRADRTGAVVSDVKHSHSRPSTVSKLPPKFELQMGRKWAVENQIGNKNLIIDDCDTKQSVYIFGCKDSVLQVKGKVNNITVDKCTKMGIVFMDVVAAFEIVNCNGVEVQCQGSAPTISVDNTSGCQLYLACNLLCTSITTAKSTEVNVLVPGAGSDSDWVEHPLPQQYLHTFKDSEFITTPVSHSGA